MTPANFAVLGALGATVGSFTGTAAIRSTRREQVIAGRSRCDACQTSLGALESLPIFGFVALRGKCRRCASKIAPTHFLAECAGIGVVVSALVVASLCRAAVLLPLGFLLIALTCIDLEVFLLPNVLVGAVGVVCSFLAVQLSAERLLVGLAAAFVAMALLELVRRGFSSLRGEDGLGQGDVKLIGALAIWQGMDTAAMVASACLFGLVSQWLVRGKGRRIAFGPYIALAAWIIGLCREGGVWPALG